MSLRIQNAKNNQIVILIIWLAQAQLMWAKAEAKNSNQEAKIRIMKYHDNLAFAISAVIKNKSPYQC